MNNNLLIIGAGEYGMLAKEIAEEMGNFEKIDFLDDEYELAICKKDEYESFYSEYSFAIAACEDGSERIKLTHMLEDAMYVVPPLVHLQAHISPTSNIMRGCIVLPGVVVELQTTIGIGTIIGANSVVESYCFVGDGCLLKAGTIVHSKSRIMKETVTEYGTVLFEHLT